MDRTTKLAITVGAIALLGALLPLPAQRPAMQSLIPSGAVGATGGTGATGATGLASVQYCGTTTTCGHTNQTDAKIAYGSAALVSGSPSAAAVTGLSPAFTSTATYDCTIAAQTAATNALLSIAKVSGSAFTITGPDSDTRVVNYICVGN